MNDLVHLFSNPGDVVLDSYMGSGTTGMACIAQGRKFIGIERGAQSFDLACRRIESVYAQRRLFA